jgi:hypothetical protein
LIQIYVHLFDRFMSCWGTSTTIKDAPKVHPGCRFRARG